MLLRNLATGVAAGRIAFGAGLVLAPRLLAGPWIGARAGDPRTQLVIRGFGARDLALGVGGLRALHGGDAGPARWWFAAQALGDATDLVVTLAAGDALPRPVKAGVAVLASGAVAIGCAVAVAGPDAVEPSARQPGSCHAM